MKKLIISVVLMLSISSAYSQTERNLHIQHLCQSYMIVAFGSSLTVGGNIAEEKWTTILQEMLRQKHPDIYITVINAGINGSSTRDRLSHLQNDVLDLHPDLVIQDFAANDANHTPERHVYFDEFIRNIKTMHDQIVLQTSAAEIYWPQTPILNENHSWRQQPLYVEAGGFDKYAGYYRKCTAKVSHELHVPFVNMDAIFRKKFKEKEAAYYLLSDGIHLQKSGNQVVAENLLPVIEKIMKKKVKKIKRCG